jgi:hypothetical protein
MIDIREEKITIPTYEVGAADKNPMFLEKRVYQGSSGKIYPYPTTQKISREKKDKVYNAVVLENDYLRVVVLPELGGRIQRAYDKTNGYDFVYYNHVIKPALVGTDRTLDFRRYRVQLAAASPSVHFPSGRS